MTKLEMVQAALQAAKSASSEEISAFIEKTFGVKIEAKFIPVFKSSLLGRELVTRSRDVSSKEGDDVNASVPQAA